MSDKNFKVKNGIDAAGKLTITNTSGATSLIEVNGAGGGQFTITPYGGISTNAGFYSIGGPSYFGGYGGTTSVVVNVTGASGQTEDLQRWTTFGGTVLAKVDSAGSISATDLTLSGNLIVNGTTTNLNSTNLIIEDKNIIIADVATPTDTTADGAGITIKGATDKTFNWVNSTKSFTSSEPLVIDTSSTSSTALVVKASPTYPAHLQEWQNASGTTLAQIGYNGNASFYNIVPFTNSGTYVSLGSGAIDFISRATTTPTVRVSGAASQTADLQQWQNSSGTVLANVDASGQITATNGIQYGKIGPAGFQSGGSSGIVDIHYNGGNTTIRGGSAYTSNTSLLVGTGYNAGVGIIVQGVASQTADLQQWRNSAGTVLARINSAGAIKSTILADLTDGYSLIRFNYDTNGIGITTGAAAQKGLIIRGAASQTANLQEWQDSSGTVLARVASNGYFETSGGLGVPSNASISYALGIGGASAYLGNAMVAISTANGATSSVGILVRGVSGQTGDLQQWQNSSGTVLAKISAYGDLIIPDSRVAIGASSVLPNTMLFANTAYSNYAPIVVRGAASQTANLQEWQDSSGFVRSRINPAGTFLVNGGSYIEGSGRVFVNSSSAAYIPLTVRGTTSQTGNLQEWQNSSGTVLAKVDASGALTVPSATIAYVNFYSNGNTSFGGTTQTYNLTAGSSTSVGTFTVTSTSASTIGAVIRAAASQTANLQEWQDSSGTVLARVNQNGAIVSSSVGIFGAQTAITDTELSVYSTVATQSGIVVKSAVAQSNFMQQWQNSAGTLISYVGSGGNFGSSVGFYNDSTATNIGDTGNLLQSNSASNVPVVVKGRASQTANLQEWQNSSGTTLSYIDKEGQATLTGGYISALYTGGGITGGTLGYLNASTFSASISPIVVRGAASQTADLQQWQKSDGTVIVRFDAYGSMYGFNNAVYGNAYGDVLGRATYYTAPATIGVVIRGAASQTANLQQWQDSTGTVLASLNSNGSFTTTQGIIATGNYASSFGGSVIGGTILTIKANSAGNKAVVIQGAASQTANLQEWQNSAGTVLGQVDSSGNLNFLNKIVYANQLYVGTGNYLSASMHNISGGAGEMRLLLRAHGSQTASIQEWQNNSGIALAKVDANGNFSAISKSFDIPHPTKENMRLRYASLEGPENGVYIRGTAEFNIIELPEYWTGLVHENSITVSLTAVGSAQNIYVEKIENNKIYIGGELTKAFFTVYGERKDTDKLTVEY